jgi:16S rRNA (guanine527-N7)-methyltransferase
LSGRFDFELAISSRAEICGIKLAKPSVRGLARHARRVLHANKELGLTSITEPREFLERHIGEGFEGAAMLAEGVEGELLDLGSGNGYPALPLVAARPGLKPLLAEASAGKAQFLRLVLAECFGSGEVLAGQVQRPSDLKGCGPFRLMITRAMGGWEKILPRMAICLQDGGELLVWAGQELEAVARRSAWRRLELLEKRALPGRERSWIWRLGRAL